MANNGTLQLHEAISAVCPIDGVSVRRFDDKDTWRIDFGTGATDQQKSAAAAVVAAFDVATAVPALSFLARDFFAELTVADFTALKAAIAANDALALLWASLQAQGEAPISTAALRFQSGWAGLRQALGEARADEIATALGFGS